MGRLAEKLNTGGRLQAQQETSGALFPSISGENPLMAGAKAIGNLPGSVYGLGKGILDVVTSPIKTLEMVGRVGAGAIQSAPSVREFYDKYSQGAGKEQLEKNRQTFQALTEALMNRYGSLENLQKSATEDPFGIGTDIYFLAQGGAGLLGKTKEVSALTQKVGQAVIRPAEKAITRTGELATKTGLFGTSQATGLNPETIQTVFESGRELGAARTEGLSRQTLGLDLQNTIQSRIETLSDLGKGYEPIRTAGTPVMLPENWFENVLARNKIGVENGKILTTKESTVLSPTDISELQRFYNTYGKEAIHTSNSFLNTREALSQMSKYDATKTGNLEAIARDARETLNASRNQIEGLKSLDETYAPEIKDLKQIKKEWFDPKTGELKDNAVSKLANAGNIGREKVLARLEAVQPGVTQQIKLVKAIEDIQRASGIKVGTYTRGALLGGTALFGSLLTAVAMAIFTAPEVAMPLIKGLGLTKAKLAPLLDTLRVIGGDINNFRVPGAVQRYLENPKVGLGIEDVSKNQELFNNLRGAKGMTAEDITKKFPDIQLKRDVPATDIYGNKVKIPEGEALTPYELKGNKVLLQDGETYIVSKSQFQNIKGQSVVAETKEFAPELKGLEESVRGGNKLPSGSKIIENKSGEYKFSLVDEKGNVLFDANSKDVIYEEATARTKFSQYQLPGGKNYKEILIKAPVEKPSGMSTADYTEKLRQGTFKSSHWDEPNVISHLRLNERTYNGKKVTFMEEAQSDWARAGREKGFKRDMTPEEFTQVKKNYEYTGGGNPPKTVGEIPFHPLVEGGKWVEPSVKRGLKEAVTNDSEYFAWITGEQTSARYNLATHLDDVKWHQDFTNQVKKVNLTPKNQAPITLAIKRDGTILSGREFGMGGENVPSEWAGKKLDEVLGKGLADQIMSKESGTLSGEGLKFGGEWANNLYDKQVKNIVEDVTGGKVEIIDMGLPMGGGNKLWKQSNGSDLYPQAIRIGKRIIEAGSNKEYVIAKIDGNKMGVVQMSDTLTADEVGARVGQGYKKIVSEKHFEKDLYYHPNLIETFDISTKTTTQQGIKLTPEIKARIRGETPKIKTSGKRY